MPLIDRIAASNQGPKEIIDVISQAKLNSQEVLVKRNGEVGTRGWLGKKLISIYGAIRGEAWRDENKRINNHNVATAFVIKTKQAFAGQYADEDDKAYVEQKIQSLFDKGRQFGGPKEQIRHGVYSVGFKLDSHSIKLVEAKDLRDALIEIDQQLPSKLRRHQEKTAQAAAHLQADYGSTGQTPQPLAAAPAAINLDNLAWKYQVNPQIAKFLVGGGPEFGKVATAIVREGLKVDWAPPLDQRYADALNVVYQQEANVRSQAGVPITDNDIRQWAIAALKQVQAGSNWN